MWRSLLHVQRLLSRGMERQFQATSSISAADFAVLVTLTDNEDGRLRISELARQLQWERSRLSHQLNRMARRGLITKHRDTADARGAWAEVTEAGRETLRLAAPPHVDWVRDHVIDPLTPEEVDQLTGIMAKLERALLAEESPGD